MKFKVALLLGFSFLLSALAQDARFFRIAGPVATTITAFSADGYVAWTNAPTNATFTVQTAVSLIGPSNWVDYIQVPVTNPVTVHRLYDPNPPVGMALIPAGSYTMGDTVNDCSSCDRLPTHAVYVSAFYMDKYEVTDALWESVYQWATNNGYTFEDSNSGQGKAADHPGHSMTWYDGVKWCNARSEQEGRVPAYYTSSAQTTVYRSGHVPVQNNRVKWNGGYRLPTEAEWEKAARGGSSGLRYPWGNTITHGQANYYSSSSAAYDISPTPGYHPTFNDAVYPYTSPVGYFAPNGYELYDMAGNVWEWCWDWYGPYSSGSQTDPRGPVSGTDRVSRGGSWYGSGPTGCRVAFRWVTSASYRYYDTGFRSVLPAGQRAKRV